jgi:hypothetical protein
VVGVVVFRRVELVQGYCGRFTLSSSTCACTWKQGDVTQAFHIYRCGGCMWYSMCWQVLPAWGVFGERKGCAVH